MRGDFDKFGSLDDGRDVDVGIRKSGCGPSLSKEMAKAKTKIKKLFVSKKIITS